MIKFDEAVKVYVSLGIIDFRPGLDGLLSLVESTFGHVPQERYLFLFRDRSHRKIKALFWDKNGFVLFYKRLEDGKFQFPKNQAGNIELNRLQLECSAVPADKLAMGVDKGENRDSPPYSSPTSCRASR